jgi:hypothetical protein
MAMKKLLLAGVAALLLATGTAYANDAAIRICDKRFQAGELQPGDEIGACYAKATNNHCDGDLDGSRMQVCTDWVDSHPKPKPAEPKWWTDCRHGWITKEFEEIDKEYPQVEIFDTTIRITYDELRKLVKELPFILRKVKACDAYRKCLDDRNTGKVKHCYENDRRWREFFTGAW